MRLFKIIIIFDLLHDFVKLIRWVANFAGIFLHRLQPLFIVQTYLVLPLFTQFLDFIFQGCLVNGDILSHIRVQPEKIFLPMHIQGFQGFQGHLVGFDHQGLLLLELVQLLIGVEFGLFLFRQHRGEARCKVDLCHDGKDIHVALFIGDECTGTEHH